MEEFADQIIDQIVEYGSASTDLLNDYPGGDRWHHESHVDRDYRLVEAAEILQELPNETDNGLWEGLEPRAAISAQAAYTYGNAVYAEWQELIERINEAAAEQIGDVSIDEQRRLCRAIVSDVLN